MNSFEDLEQEDVDSEIEEYILNKENPIRDLVIRDRNQTDKYHSEYQMGSKTFCEQLSCNTLLSTRNIFNTSAN